MAASRCAPIAKAEGSLNLGATASGAVAAPVPAGEGVSGTFGVLEAAEGAEGAAGVESGAV